MHPEAITLCEVNQTHKLTAWLIWQKQYINEVQNERENSKKRKKKVIVDQQGQCV